MNRDWHDMSLNELAAAIFANLSGDGDGHGEGTRAEVDHAIPSHPVIRIRTDNRGNGGDESGGGGGSSGVFKYDPETHMIGPGAICVGRQYFNITTPCAVSPSTSYRLSIDMEAPGNSIIEAGNGFAAPPSYSRCYVPLYEFDANDEIAADYRGAPVVPAWE